MYSYKERKAAVDAYIKNGYNAAATVRELGYPSHTAVVLWYQELREKGSLKESYHRERQYSEAERRGAVEYYFTHGKSLSQTIQALGLPIKRDALRNWIREFAPDRELNCKRTPPLVKYSQAQKEAALAQFCSSGKTAEQVAQEHGVSRAALYSWRRKLMAKEVDISMPERKGKAQSLEGKNAQLLQELQRVRRELEETEKRLHRAQLECDVLEKVAEVLKKEKGANPRKLSNREKAQVIGALRNKYTLKEMLESLNISKSSYEYQASALKKGDKYTELRTVIRREFETTRGRYGYRRLHAVLRTQGYIVSEKVVRRLMKEEQLAVVFVKRRRYNAYMGEISPAVENVLQRDFHAQTPNRKWLTDITEFRIPAGKVYLSPVIDCFDGMVVSWSIGGSPNAQLVNSMLDKAIRRLGEGEYPVIHSDRGGHYRWPGWIERMERAGLKRSMSRKGCSPDNAACEGFFGRLKNEMFYARSWAGASVDELIQELNTYIHWYNEKRIKLSLGAMSPVDYRRSLGLAV